MAKKIKVHFCDRCGKPAMIGMYVEDLKKMVNVCEECLMELGAAETEEAKAQILDEMVGD